MTVHHPAMSRALRNTIGDALHRSVRRNPEKDAILFGERRWTYAELDAAVNRVAHSLLARGLAKGDRVAFYGRNSDIYVIGWLACTRAGLIHVPINYMLRGEELLYIVHQSGSRALWYDEDLAAWVEAVHDRAGAEIYGSLEELLEAALDPAGDAGEVAVDVVETDVAQLLYTSGTTAAP
ncbi:MAG: AMP-binding protein, partial [Bacillota bacterium]|nr:AMP-binding protein [Bacillota bacterium]